MSPGVVIKCGDDPRILDCLDSIDSSCSVVAAGFFSDRLRAELDRRGVKLVDAPRGNLGRTANAGIEAIDAPKIVVMDSDSWFGRGTLALLDAALDDALFARARILYTTDTSVRGSAVVAATRQHLNDSLGRAYTPGLGLRREVALRLGGHLFDDAIWFAEDAEMDYRRRKAGVELVHVPGAVVYHAPVPPWHDLRAAYRVGFGKAQQVQRTDRPNDEDPLPLLGRAVRGVHPREVARWTRELGSTAAAYNCLWFGLYYFGYYEQRILRRRP